MSFEFRSGVGHCGIRRSSQQVIKTRTAQDLSAGKCGGDEAALVEKGSWPCLGWSAESGSALRACTCLPSEKGNSHMPGINTFFTFKSIGWLAVMEPEMS